MTDTLWISWANADGFWHGHRGDQTFALGIDGGRDAWEDVARAALAQSVGVDQVVAEEDLDTDDDGLTVRPLGIVQADDGKVSVWRGTT
jgi:hypothetical protein